MSRQVEGLTGNDAGRHAALCLSPDRERLRGASGAVFRRSAPARCPGAWRTAASGPMQVVSGYIGHEKVHFEAPAAERLEREISRFLEWFNAPPVSDPVLGAGIAHLWFVTIHPFEDGNGRIARLLPTAPLPARTAVLSDSTACRGKSSGNEEPIMKFWNVPRKAIWK